MGAARLLLLVGATLIGAACASATSLGLPAAGDALVQLRFGLRLDASAVAELHDTAFAVSDPSSPRWGKHLSRDAADDLVRPPAAAAATVQAWLAESPCVLRGSVSLSQGGDWVTAHAHATCAGALLGAPMTSELDAASGRLVHYLASPPVLPRAVADVVAVVTPSRPPRAQRRLQVSSMVGAPGGTTPSTIRSAYGIGDAQGAGAASSNTVQISGFLGEYAEDSDLQAFFKAYYPPGVGRSYKVVGPDGAIAGVEASLDVQYVMSIGANVSATFWYTDAGPGPNPYENEPYLTWLLAVTALPDGSLPNTLSTSYADNEWTIDPTFLLNVETLMAKLAARGSSLLHASGDGGVSGTQSGACPYNRFVPTWPASSPFVTSVGATDTSYAKASGFSGGGFSDVHTAPAFQAAAIAKYKATAAAAGTLPAARYFNATGRGIPDVAAVGEQFHIISGGRDFEVAGTSCSTPTFAGVIALLNDARVSAGKKPLGLLNALLYAHPEVFTDIAAGSNPGCGTQGFPAVRGWDAATGLGAPIYPALRTLVLSLP